MQPRSEIKHHPVDLSRHGLNPHGESIYRVVWADSRRSKVLCRGKMYEMPRYTHETDTKGLWVLEKWAPAEVIVGMTREQYEAFLTTFPNAAAEDYPERGEWELSAVFNADFGPFARNVDEIALHKQLEFHEWNADRKTAADHVREAEAVEAAKKAKTDEKFEVLYEEAREESLCR